MLFEQAVYEYIDAKQFGRKPVRANTLEGYVSAIRCHLLPKWSGREIETITCGEIQAWMDSVKLCRRFRGVQEAVGIPYHSKRTYPKSSSIRSRRI